MKSLRLCTYNLENLFFGQSSPQGILTTPARAEQLARNIINIGADIYALCEVGGEDSLTFFNHQYLDDRFLVSLIPGNSDRNIQLAYLVKKNLPFRCTHHTHRKKILDLSYPEDPPTKKYHHSRDIAELRIYDGQDVSEFPSTIILMVHLKSQRLVPGKDPKGVLRRASELRSLAATYHSLQQQFGKNTPILLCGDFNDIHQCAPEGLNHLDLLELLELPLTERKTLFSFRENNKLSWTQFDYIWIPPQLQHRLEAASSGIFFPQDDQFRPLLPPEHSFSLNPLGSDHLPLVAQFHFL